MTARLGGASPRYEVRATFFQIGGLPILANQFMLMVFSTIERR